MNEQTRDRPVTVWATPFDVHYARIEFAEKDPVTDSQLKAIARKAMRAYLGNQIGPGYRMRLEYLGMSRNPSVPGVLYATFREL